MTKTNAGSPKGRESYGDGVPIVVAGVTTCQGRRENRLQGEGEQVTGHRETERYAKCRTRPVWTVAVSRDGQRVVSGGADNTLRVWGLFTGIEEAHWKTDAAGISSCCAHPSDPTTFVYGDEKGRVVAMSLVAGRP